MHPIHTIEILQHCQKSVFWAIKATVNDFFKFLFVTVKYLRKAFTKEKSVNDFFIAFL